MIRINWAEDLQKPLPPEWQEAIEHQATLFQKLSDNFIVKLVEEEASKKKTRS